MEEPAKRVAPDGWPTITPRIVAPDPGGLVRFLCVLSEVEGDYQADAPSVLTIGDSKIMVSNVGQRGPSAAFLYVYVADVARVHQRALKLGAVSIEEPFETPYGDVRCMLEDRWGNVWQVAQRQIAERAA